VKPKIAGHRNAACARSWRAAACLRRYSVAGCLLWTVSLFAQQPAEPVNINPIDGQAYYLVNQLSGLQADLDAGSATAGSPIVIEDRSFTSLTQRWAMTSLPGGQWTIVNLESGLCLDSASSGGVTMTVQNPCSPATATQQWSFTASGNGYATLRNHGASLVLDVQSGPGTAGTALVQTTLSGTPTQSQQWLLRPVFFRGIDNALLEKQEALRIAGGIPWWQDAGQTGDLLQMLKNHGINMVRVRPTSEPPYTTYSSSSCTGDGCYAETESDDIDLARRATQLGMSVELTLFFDGGSSDSLPGDWSSDTLSQAETDVYNYVKSEVEAYRSAGAMPDMVTIGNEVDTGFFGSLGSPTGSNFGPFAALQKQAMQAILDASSDPSLGSPLPPPIRCIHITPNWDLTSFFTLVNSNGIPYDAMCQSYYPFFHGPLTAAQASTSNPNKQPVEETALANAANSIGKPIFIIETGEHYENGFDSNDPWYPATMAGQRQFLIDLDAAMKNLPSHLGMGIEYWDPAGVDIPKSGGSGYVNGDGRADAIFTWNGLTLFDNADSSGSTQVTAANYSALLPATDALGGKLDPTLAYKFVNVASGEVLGTAGLPSAAGTALETNADTDVERLDQQWTITSNNDGYFQIASRNVVSGTAVQVLDNSGSSTAGSGVVAAAASGDAGQEWNIVTAGNGSWTIVNKSSGMVLTAASASSIQQQQASAASTDWITPASVSQQWKLIPVNITAAATPSSLSFDAGTPSTLVYGAALGVLDVSTVDSSGSLVPTSGDSVTLTVTGPGGYKQTQTASTTNGVAAFDLTSMVPPETGSYTLAASAIGATSASQSLTVTPADLTVAANNASRVYGAANPAFTWSATGFVNGDSSSVVTGAPLLSTPATASSAPGTYPIAVAAGTLAAANYTFSFVNGTLTVTAGTTSTGLTTNLTTVNPGQSVTLTATVTSAPGTHPAGTVTFVSGSATLGTAALSAGVATLATTVSPGVNSIVAQYGGNSDFSASSSAPVTVTEPDFAISTNESGVSLSAGSTASVTLTIAPIGGYTGAIAVSCSSTLASVACSPNPASFTANGSDAALTGAVALTAASTSALVRSFQAPGRHNLLAAAALFFPGLLILGVRPRRRTHAKSGFALPLLALLLGGTLTLTACGGNSANGGGGTPTQTGTVILQATGSAGTVSQSLTLDVTVR
jgi:arabinogalactan endo-1,4-beta-galactosidase